MESISFRDSLGGHPTQNPQQWVTKGHSDERQIEIMKRPLSSKVKERGREREIKREGAMERDGERREMDKMRAAAEVMDTFFLFLCRDLVLRALASGLFEVAFKRSTACARFLSCLCCWLSASFYGAAT